MRTPYDRRIGGWKGFLKTLAFLPLACIICTLHFGGWVIIIAYPLDEFTYLASDARILISLGLGIPLTVATWVFFYKS